MKRAYKHRVYAISIDTLITSSPLATIIEFCDFSSRSLLLSLRDLVKFSIIKYRNGDIIRKNKEGKIAYEDFISFLREKLEIGAHIEDEEIITCWNAACQIGKPTCTNIVTFFKAAVVEGYSIIIPVSKDPVQYERILEQLNQLFALNNIPNLEENDHVVLIKSFIEGNADETSLTAKVIKKYNLDLVGSNIVILDNNIMKSKIPTKNINIFDTSEYKNLHWFDRFIKANTYIMPRPSVYYEYDVNEIVYPSPTPRQNQTSTNSIGGGS